MRSTRSTIFITVAALVAIGIVMIYSASAIYADSVMKDSLYYIKRHLIYISIGLFMMVLAMSIDLGKIRSAAKPLLLVAIALLVVVLIPHIGSQTAGARRWQKPICLLVKMIVPKFIWKIVSIIAGNLWCHSMHIKTCSTGIHSMNITLNHFTRLGIWVILSMVILTEAP